MALENWQNYRRTGITRMRPYIVGEDLAGISVGNGVTPEVGGMVARSLDDPADQWYVSKAYFEKHFELMPSQRVS